MAGVLAMSLPIPPLSLDAPLRFDQPLDVDDARRALHLVAEQRRQAREWLSAALKDRAEKEHTYRIARARAWATNTQGTAKEREDKVNEVTAPARQERDLAEGVIRSAYERLQEVDAERSSLHRLCDWSMRMMDLSASEPREPVVFGGRG